MLNPLIIAKIHITTIKPPYDHHKMVKSPQLDMAVLSSSQDAAQKARLLWIVIGEWLHFQQSQRQNSWTYPIHSFNGMHYHHLSSTIINYDNMGFPEMGLPQQLDGLFHEKSYSQGYPQFRKPPPESTLCMAQKESDLGDQNFYIVCFQH